MPRRNQAAVCWQPVVLESSRIQLRFAGSFEFAVGFDPARGTVMNVELRPLLNASSSKPHEKMLRDMFARLQPSLHAEVRACATPADVAALLPALSLQLGRLLELSREVEMLARAVPIEISRAEGGCVRLLLGYSFFQVRPGATLEPSPSFPLPTRTQR